MAGSKGESDVGFNSVGDLIALAGAGSVGEQSDQCMMEENKSCMLK